ATLKVAIARAEGTAIHRVPCASSQLASARVSYLPPGSGAVAIGPPSRCKASKSDTLPLPPTATASPFFHGNTIGDELKSAFGAVADDLSSSVFGLSAISEFDNGADPSVVAT